MTGYAREEVLGRNCRFLQGEETCTDTTMGIRKAVEGGVCHSCVILNYTKNGDAFWNKVSLKKKNILKN